MLESAMHQENGAEGRPPSPLEQLQRLATELPHHIEHVVLPALTDEVHHCVAELTAQADGTRQLLLQSAVLRRSVVLAPLLKQQLVRDAAQLQRRREQLLQVLQRHERQTRAARSASSAEVRRVWHILELAMAGEERFSHVVQAPLRPTDATLTAFLTEAVTQQELHRRVQAQVEGSTAPSPQPEGSGEAAADAVEAALHLLLHHLRLEGTPKDSAGNTSAAVRQPQERNSSTSEGTLRRPASPLAGSSLAGVVDVDGDYDVDADDALAMADEEDTASLRTQHQPQQQTQQGNANTGPWLRVPGIVSLRQYCADLPWVVELAEQQYTAARELKKNGGGTSASGGGDIGYFSRHVQPEEKEKGTAGKAAASPAGTLSSAAPLGCVFAPSLAASTGSPTPLAGRAEAASARGRRTTTTTADATSQARSPTAERGEGGLPALDGHTWERVGLARAVAQCVVPAVDAAWADVDSTVLLPFCRASAQAVGSHGDKENDHEEEEEATAALLEVVRVRYAVELAARVVAARQAVELLLDSEDSVIFDGARLQSLSLKSVDVGVDTTDVSQPQQGLGTSCASSVLACTVLTLPGLENLFYVVAYCAGAAMLREAAAAADITAGARTRGGESGQPLVIDVDAPEETEGAGEVLVDEEDARARQQAGLQAWATGFEQRFLASTATTFSCPSFAALFRLWLYLWEFALTVLPASVTGTSGEDGENAQQRAGTRPSRHSAGGRRTELHVSLRTARRWMERVINASLCNGVAESGVLRTENLQGSLESCLPRCWTQTEREQVVRLTAAQAREALLHAAGVDVFSA